MMLHDSHDIFFRNPFGAVPCGERINIRLNMDISVDAQSVILRIWRDTDGEEKLKMNPLEQSDGVKTYEVNIKAPSKPGLFWYYFIVECPNKTYFYGNNAGRFGGTGQVYEYPPESYQITVYRRQFTTPDWFKDCVMYQIFVDRFCSGSNDGSILNKKENSIIHEDWNDTPCYKAEPVTGKFLNNDFFGGNLKGIIKKLPYLKELGIDVIYMNPIFESPSNHKYNTGDYMNIDPMFGENRTFKELCVCAGRLGISIILDGVFSHTGSDSIYFNREGNYPSLGACQSRESPYYSWYTFKSYPESYECWWDIDTLPNVRELDPFFQDFILYNEDSVVKYWMKLGCMGWRLDVADELPDEFIKKLRKTVKESNPEAVIIGEVWEDASNKISYGKIREYLLGEELDSAVNYPLRQAILKFFTGEWNGARFNRALLSLYENYPPCTFYSMMNILGSHDTGRILTLLGTRHPDGMGQEEDGITTLNEEQRALAVKRLKLVSLFQMVFPGVPCIYYGDEAGLEGGKDPFCRKTYPWGKEDSSLIEWYKKIIAIRHELAPLRTGHFVPLYCQGSAYGFARIISDGKDVFGNERKNGFVLALFNSSIENSHIINIDLCNWGIGKLQDILSNVELSLDKGRISIELAPLEGKLFQGGGTCTLQ